MELAGQTAVITGASGRLGSQIAKGLAAAGCKCVCHYKSSRSKAEEVVEAIRAAGSEAMAVGADLTDPWQIEEMFEKGKEIGEPRILINSAAVFSRQRLAEVSFDEARKVLDLNVAGPILVSGAFVKRINNNFPDAESPTAKIINISDAGGVKGWAEYVVYCSSKAGLNGATKAMAKELAPTICVNSVAVGIVDWPEDFDEVQKRQQLSFIPIGRVGKASEITRAIIFLIKNDYITGQVLNVDGGRAI